MGNNQVVHALDTLSRTVRGIGRDKSRSDIALKSLGLRGKQQDYDMTRESVIDDRATEKYEQAQPGRELKSQEARTDLEAYNKPFGVASLGVDAIEHGLHELKDKTLVVEKWAKILDDEYVLDKDPDSPTHTSFLKDGKTIPVGSINQRDMEAAIRSTLHPELTARTRYEKIDADLAKGTITQQQHSLKREQIFEFVNNIPKQIGANETVIKELSRIGTSAAKQRIKELERKNDNMAKEWRTREAVNKRLAERTKAGVGKGKEKAPKAGWLTLKKVKEDGKTYSEGEKVTISQLKTLYREHNNIPDEFQLLMMEMSENPEKKNMAAEYRKKLDINSFRDFVNRMTIEGKSYNWDKKAGEQKTIAKTGKTKDGRKVVQYSDGSIEYAD